MTPLTFPLTFSMLHLDPRRRPAVEEFEKIKAMAPYLREANNKLREYNDAATSAAKARQVANANQQAIDVKLKDIAKKEAELLSREKSLDDREKSITLREHNLGARESEMKRQEQKFATKVSEWKQQQATDKTDTNSTAVTSNNVVTATSISRKTESCPAATETATTTAAPPMQTRQTFKIYQDKVQTTLPLPPPAKVIDIIEAGKPKGQDFLKLQHKRFLKLGNEENTTAVTAANKRPPPPPPFGSYEANGSKRKAMNINVPPVPTMKTNVIKIDEANKENIEAAAAAHNVQKRQRTTGNAEPIKSSTFLAELSRKNAQPIVRRIN